MRDFLYPVPGGGCDAQVFQQRPKTAGGDRSFNPKGLHLDVTQGRVLFIGLVFYVMVLRLLLLLSRQALSRWALRDHQLYHKRLLLLWCMLWWIGL
jgi:hypothetical protein